VVDYGRNTREMKGKKVEEDHAGNVWLDSWFTVVVVNKQCLIED
jgi:hypothetical protein